MALKIALTSRNQIKRNAVLQAFIHDNIKLSCFPVIDDDQIEQPIGRSGVNMAIRRVHQVLDKYPEIKQDYDLVVSIENFLDLKDMSTGSDFACCLMIDLNRADEPYFCEVLCAQLPTSDLAVYSGLLQNSYGLYNDQDELLGASVTFGETYHQVHPEVPANNWMPAVGYPSREVSLTNGVQKIVDQWKADGKLKTELEKCFKYVENFPIEGVNYMMWDDIFLNVELMNRMISYMARKYLPQMTITKYDAGSKIDYVIGVASRGFLLSSPLSQLLGVGQLLLRKKGKIAGPRVSRTYTKEYGEDTLELRNDLPGGNVLIVDDVLATGGSLQAAAELAREAGHTVIDCIVVKDVPALREMASEKMKGIPYRVILP